MNREDILNNFVRWAALVADRIGSASIEAWVTQGEACDNPSARLDIDTPAVVARITCWASGDYNTEIIDLKTEEVLFSDHGCLREEDDLSGLFSPFFKVLKINGVSNP